MTGKITNREFTQDIFFREACALAGLEPTKRQASKFRNGKGRAFRAAKKVRK